MSAAQFTPGPWHWVGSDEIEQVEHPFTSVAEVVSIPKNVDPDGSQLPANARLIAAAPELYEALEVTAAQLLLVPNSDASEAKRIAVIERAIAALAKARGE